MGKIKVVLVVAIIVFAIMVGGQVVVAEWTNLEFQDDLHDISSSLASRIGLTAPPSDQEIRVIVMRKAGSARHFADASTDHSGAIGSARQSLRQCDPGGGVRHIH